MFVNGSPYNNDIGNMLTITGGVLENIYLFKMNKRNTKVVKYVPNSIKGARMTYLTSIYCFHLTSHFSKF